MTKLTDSELWDALEEEAVDDEMEAVLAKTPEERRQDLREAGFDLEKVHAQADALVAEPTRPAKVIAPRPWRKRLAIALPTAAALAAGVALVVNLSTPRSWAKVGPTIRPVSVPRRCVGRRATRAAREAGRSASIG